MKTIRVRLYMVGKDQYVRPLNGATNLDLAFGWEWTEPNNWDWYQCGIFFYVEDDMVDTGIETDVLVSDGEVQFSIRYRIEQFVRRVVNELRDFADWFIGSV